VDTRPLPVSTERPSVRFAIYFRGKENSRESDALSPFAINSNFGIKILLSTPDIVNKTPINPNAIPNSPCSIPLPG
jgi:hypothetical protein